MIDLDRQIIRNSRSCDSDLVVSMSSDTYYSPLPELGISEGACGGGTTFEEPGKLLRPLDL